MYCYCQRICQYLICELLQEGKTNLSLDPEVRYFNNALVIRVFGFCPFLMAAIHQNNSLQETVIKAQDLRGRLVKFSEMVPAFLFFSLQNCKNKFQRDSKIIYM